MMKKILVVCVALLSATILLARPYSQQGISYLYDYKTKTKTPVANVSLTVAYAKGPAVSQEDGTFTIEFQDFGIGKKLAFEKQPFSPGLIVLNKKEVDGWSTFEGKLTLIMCNKNDFDVCKQNYYDVGFESVTQNYERKIAALKKETADYQQRVQDLEEERDRIIDNLRNSADAMARIDQSELDDAMQEVLKLYEQGYVEEAMRKLENMKLTEKFMHILDIKHEGENIVAKATEDSVLMLSKLRTSVDMYKNSGNLDKAAEILKLLADMLNSPEDIFDYAYLCQEQNDFHDTELYYKKALDIFLELFKDNPEKYELDVAMTLNNLANLYKNIQRLPEAEKLYEQALYILGLSEDNQPYLAQTLNNLANLYKKNHRLPEAEKLYEQALDIYLGLSEDNPKEYEPSLATTLNNLANLYHENNQFLEAEEMHEQALEIRQRLAKDNPKTYEPDVAVTLNNLANVYYIMDRFSDAEEMHKQALEIRQRLAKDNPKAYEPDVAVTLNNLALLYADIQRIPEAEKMFKQALEIRQRLADNNPMAYDRVVALTLNSLADLYYITHRFSEAEEMYKQALEIRQRLAKDNPKAYEPDVAQTLCNLGVLYYDMNKQDEGKVFFQKALEYYAHFAINDSASYQQKIITLEHVLRK